MFKSNSSPLPASSPRGKTTILHNDGPKKPESAQEKLASQISQFESLHVKNMEIISQFEQLNHEKEKHYAQIKSSDDNLLNIAPKVNIANKEVINSNLTTLLTPSSPSINTQYGKTDVNALMLLIKNDPTLSLLSSQLVIELQNIQQAKEKISTIQSSMARLSKNKELIQSDLANSRMELTKTIDGLKAASTGAVNDSELQQLLSLATQKIAAADLSELGYDLAQAQNTFSHTQFLLDDSTKKLQPLLNQALFHQNALSNTQDEFIKRSKYQDKSIHFKKNEFKTDFLADPNNKKISEDVMESLFQYSNEFKNNSFLKSCLVQAERHLLAAKAEFHQSEIFFEESSWSVENAQMALDAETGAEVPDLSSADDTLNSDRSAAMRGNGHAMDDNPADEQVITVGTDEQLELV